MSFTYKEALVATFPQNWDKHSPDDKAAILQTIGDYIATEQGRASCPVETRVLRSGKDSFTCGSYSRDLRKIYLNASQLDPKSSGYREPDAVLKTLLHESRHAYQDDAVRGRIDNLQEDPATVRAWAKNMRQGNYIQFRKNPKRYWKQPLEADAREYASVRFEVLKVERDNAQVEAKAAAEAAAKAKAASEAAVKMKGAATGEAVAGIGSDSLVSSRANLGSCKRVFEAQMRTGSASAARASARSASSMGAAFGREAGSSMVRSGLSGRGASGIGANAGAVTGVASGAGARGTVVGAGTSGSGAGQGGARGGLGLGRGVGR